MRAVLARYAGCRNSLARAADKTGRSQARCSIPQQLLWVEQIAWLLRVSELANQRLCGDDSLLTAPSWPVLASKSKGRSHSVYQRHQAVDSFAVPRRKQLANLKKQPLLTHLMLETFTKLQNSHSPKNNLSPAESEKQSDLISFHCIHRKLLASSKPTPKKNCAFPVPGSHCQLAGKPTNWATCGHSCLA